MCFSITTKFARCGADHECLTVRFASSSSSLNIAGWFHQERRGFNSPVSFVVLAGMRDVQPEVGYMASNSAAVRNALCLSIPPKIRRTKAIRER